MSEQPLSDKMRQFIADLEVTQGDHLGTNWTILPWEDRLLDFLDQPQNIAISLARGNGKTSFAGVIGAAGVIGPLALKRGDWNCIASSHNQASILFEHAIAAIQSAGHDPYDRKLFRLVESSGKTMVQDRRTQSRLRCLGSDPKRAHGMAGSFLLDEGAQWPSNTGLKMRNAARTGLGKIPGSKMIAIGTQPANPDHWFRKMLNDPLVNRIVYAPPEKLVKERPYDEDVIRMANPSYDHLPSLRDAIRLEAHEAKMDPDIASSFAALRLNGGTEEENKPLLIGAENWARIEQMKPAQVASERNGCVWGCDLSSGDAQTSCAAYYPLSGLLRAISAWPENPTLEERTIRDAAGDDYFDCYQEGTLRLIGEHSVHMGKFFEWALERFGAPKAIVADKWKADALKQGLADAGVPFCPLILRRMGWFDGGEDVSSFRKACADGWVRPERTKLLRASMSSARVVEDDAGNAKQAKGSEAGRRQRAKDDATSATVLAVGLGYREAKRIGLERPTLEEESFLDGERTKLAA